MPAAQRKPARTTASTPARPPAAPVRRFVRPGRVKFARDVARQIVQGVFYVAGERVERRLCSFAEAGLDGAGKLPRPTQRNQDRLTRYLEGLYLALANALEQEAAASSPAGRDVGTLMDEWIAEARVTRAAGTIKIYNLVKTQYLEAAGPHVMPVTDQHVIQFTGWLRTRPATRGGKPSGRPLADHTVNQRLLTLRAFLRWAERQGAGPAPRVQEVKSQHRLPRVLTDAQVLALLARIRKNMAHPNPATARRAQLHERFAMVARFTGARLSEVFHLTWGQIDLDARVIHIRSAGNFLIKEGREKSPPMPPVLHAYLTAQRAACPDEVYLLDGVDARGRHRIAYSDPDSISKAFTRHFAAIGAEGVKPTHGFRAKLASSLWQEAGLDMATIQTWLGHRQQSTTMGYFADPQSRLQAFADQVPDGGVGAVLGEKLGTNLERGK